MNDVVWGKPVGGLRLGIPVTEPTERIIAGELYLENVTDKPIVVCATSNTTLVGCEIRVAPPSEDADVANLSAARGGGADRARPERR